MLDSSGVFDTSLAKGKHQFMGDFDECLEINISMDNIQGINHIRGQYCTLDLPVQLIVGNQTKSNSVSRIS